MKKAIRPNVVRMKSKSRFSLGKKFRIRTKTGETFDKRK